MFKIIIVVGLVYFLLKYNTLKSKLSSLNQNDSAKINKNKNSQDDEGEFIDYEEVE
ncbi:MAG: hypothetical protein AAF573_02185 [Bacteroidota bacterium]